MLVDLGKPLLTCLLFCVEAQNKPCTTTQSKRCSKFDPGSRLWQIGAQYGAESQPIRRIAQLNMYCITNIDIRWPTPDESHAPLPGPTNGPRSDGASDGPWSCRRQRPDLTQDPWWRQRPIAVKRKSNDFKRATNYDIFVRLDRLCLPLCNSNRLQLGKVTTQCMTACTRTWVNAFIHIET